MLKHLLHGVTAVFLWVVFVYYWRIVLRQPMNPDTRTALVTLAVLTAASIAYLTVWISHNIRIHQRLERRRKRRAVGHAIHSDYLGRLVVLEDPEGLRRANFIEVGVTQNRVSGRPVEQKIFRAGAATR